MKSGSGEMPRIYCQWLVALVGSVATEFSTLKTHRRGELRTSLSRLMAAHSQLRRHTVPVIGNLAFEFQSNPLPGPKPLASGADTIRSAGTDASRAFSAHTIAVDVPRL